MNRLVGTTPETGSLELIQPIPNLFRLGHFATIPVQGYDYCSIHTRLPEDTSFNGGIITVRRGNFADGGFVSLAGPGVTISADGYTELTTKHWRGAAYLFLEVTTAASSDTPVAIAVALKRFTGSEIAYSPFEYRSDTYTVAGNGVAVDLTANPLGDFGLQAVQTGTVTSWDVRLEGSIDGTNYTQIVAHTNVDGSGVVKWSGASRSPSRYMRSRAAGLVLGAGTNVIAYILGQE